MAQNALIRSLGEWLVDQALGSPNIVEMFESVCIRLYAAGIPITRARLVWPTLHPLFQAETVFWRKDHPAEFEQFLHQENASQAWLESPMRYITENNIEFLRRELTGPNQMLDFPLLKDLAEQGFTDYLMLATTFDFGQTDNGPNSGGKSRGIMVAWNSDREGGFSDEDLTSLQRIQRRFAIACKTVIQNRIADNITRTYLGARAGSSVLSGQIRRGDGQSTKSLIWYSDLRNSTGFAESMEKSMFFDMLNQYFESTAGPLMDEGGEVLDFIGDAVLGMFPFETNKELRDAAHSAQRALDESLRRAREFNIEREQSGMETFKYGVGLNVGKVMFGNIGIPQRLSFSVIGTTVNEVARIESMTKFLQQPVLAAKNMAELHPERWQSAGVHKLEGILEPVELFGYRALEAA